MRDNLVVIANTLSRQGWRFVHVMSMEGEIDLAAVRARFVPGEAGEVAVCRWAEVELGAQHMTLSWAAREVVRLERQINRGEVEGRSMVLWHIGAALEDAAKPASLREAIDLAGTLYSMRTKELPARALVKKLPKGATPTVAVEGIAEVELIEELWVPGGFVVIVGAGYQEACEVISHALASKAAREGAA